MLGSHWIGSYLDEAGVRKSVKGTSALKVLAVTISATWLLAMYFNESRSLTSERDVPVGDGDFEALGLADEGGTTDGVEEAWELNDCAEAQAELTAAGAYALRLGWSGHVYHAEDSRQEECWAAIALPLQRSAVGVAYRVSFKAKDWLADEVDGAELLVRGDGVITQTIPPIFQRVIVLLSTCDLSGSF